MTGRLRVGLVGCGAAGQAVHLPALASLPSLFYVSHVSDPDAERAATVASRTGAVAVSFEELVDAVDVVAIASPGHLHARQTMAACRAGARAVVVEKPFALTSAQAKAVAAVAVESGTRVAVDCMHAYDPAWRAALALREDLPRPPSVARFTTAVGSNDLLVEAQTQPVAGSPTGGPDDFLTHTAALVSCVGVDAPSEVSWLNTVLLGLATHDLPLVREALGAVDAVEHARMFDHGYEIQLRCGEIPVNLVGYVHGLRRTEWSFELLSPAAQLRVEFPPSFLTGVPARAVVHDAEGTRRAPLVRETGYRALWRQVYEAVTDDGPIAVGPEGAVADLDVVERILRVAGGLTEAAEPRERPRIVHMGAGVWSSVHLGLGGLRGRVHRVASRTFASAQSRASIFGAEPATFDDPGVWDDAELAIVAGVPGTHADQSVDALERGIPVLCEKPMARTVGEARRIAQVVGETGGRFVYGENWAFRNDVTAATEAAEELGLRRVHVAAHWPRPSWGAFFDPDYGGGCLFDGGPHPLELARLLLGRPEARWVTAELVPGGDVDADVEARVRIGFVDGAEADVEVSWTAAEARTWAEGEGFRFDLAPVPRLEVRGREVQLPAHGGVGGFLVDGGYLGELDAALGEQPLSATAEDGVAVMEIIAAAYRSAGTGEREGLPFEGPEDLSPHELWRGPARP